MTPQFMTIQEAADYLTVSHHTVRNWVAEGTITAYRIGPNGGRALRLRSDDVQALARPPVPGGKGCRAAMKVTQ